jgi:dolichol-phosphate mannosyltransferase
MVRPARTRQQAALRLPGPELTVIAPTFNERDNVRTLVARLEEVLEGIRWEIIFVDDDSPDGTAELVRSIARSDARVRCVQRLGRRGLTSACIEAALASSAPCLAIIDADLQHDERLVARMFDVLKATPVDVVIGSRYMGRTRAGSFDQRRHITSRVATRLAQTVLRADLTDPVSGFFMIRREALDEVIGGLSAVGNKILVDIFASSRRPLRFIELPYEFGRRLHGESKLDSLTALEFLLLLADKVIGRVVPLRLLLFAIVGLSGVGVHLAALAALLAHGGIVFGVAQALATGIAASSNFFLNNWLTYRDRRIKGWRLIPGLASFLAICSAGAAVNVSFAQQVFDLTGVWWAAGVAGAVIGALLNYSATALFTWGARN